jgi:hypothetical protein
VDQLSVRHLGPYERRGTRQLSSDAVVATRRGVARRSVEPGSKSDLPHEEGILDDVHSIDGHIFGLRGAISKGGSGLVPLSSGGRRLAVLKELHDAASNKVRGHA